MKPHKDLTGMTFNRLTVLSESGYNEKRRDYHWLCQCSCGNQHTAQGRQLKEGSVKSCGCLNRESAAKNGALYGPLNRGPRINLVGQRFGRLVVEAFCESEDQGTHWVCICDCGKRNVVLGHSLKAGLTRSCGCLRDEVKSCEMTARNTTHGASHSPEYSNWKAMINRAFNPRDPHYSAYGGVGKTACEFLRSSPLHLTMLIGNKPTPEHEIDRVNTHLGYFCGSCAQCVEKGWPMNVRWATEKEQGRNRVNNAMFTINGETKCASEWAEKFGMKWAKFVKQYKEHRVQNAPPNLS